jgi:uracil phosphoribosyltransferase
MSMRSKGHVVSHPLVAHKLSLMRKKETSTRSFRLLLEELSMLLAYEATRDLPTSLVPIETPLVAMDAPMIDGKKLVLVSVLRAGNGILEGFLNVMPSVVTRTRSRRTSTPCTCRRISRTAT